MEKEKKKYPVVEITQETKDKLIKLKKSDGFNQKFVAVVAIERLLSLKRCKEILAKHKKLKT
jgi:hypothetical protein